MLNTGGAASSVPGTSRPAWFEDEPFLREAKKHFLRLQDDYDRADLNDMREYLTPEMFAEINMQIRERGDQPNKTEVMTLNAAMQDVVTEGDMVIASVHFSGMIREEIGGAAETFSEVWHIQKSQSQPNATWLVSGIQQL
jgi:predicted lipid-binding transport protein (Tim44 family)